MQFALCGQRWTACFHLVSFDYKSICSQQVRDGVRDPGVEDNNNNAMLKGAVGAAAQAKL